MQEEAAAIAGENVHLLEQRTELRNVGLNSSPFAWRRKDKGRQIKENRAILRRNRLTLEKDPR